MATGGRDTGGFESQKELLVRDARPALACDQLSAYQAKELEFVMKNLDVKRDRYVGGAVSSINRYAEAVGYRSGGIGQGSTEATPHQSSPATTIRSSALTPSSGRSSHRAQRAPLQGEGRCLFPRHGRGVAP